MSTNTSAGTGTKRKRITQDRLPNKKRPHINIQEARTIASQTSGKAFGNGEVDVDKFVRAREFEIKALEDGMVRAKKVLSVRAFQTLPRELRRRTASHNVKRVPKRLQARAKREMLEDNTPTVSAKTRKLTSHKRLRVEKAKSIQNVTERVKARKEAGKVLKKKKTATGPINTRVPNVKRNVLQKPPVPKAKFRNRQIQKAWLPTHLYHTKRAHMTPPKEPLWRMAIPLTPTQKSFRPTHRAAGAQGAMAWDMSYMSTIGLEGTHTSLVGMFKNLGVGIENDFTWWRSKAKRWLAGTRSWEGMVYAHGGWPLAAISPVTVLWQVEPCSDIPISKASETKPKPKSNKRRAYIRVHPSGFLQVWNECLKLAKLQKPIVAVEDLRFDIGSIEVTGPASTEALHAVLQPCESSDGEDPKFGVTEACWSKLQSVSNPSALPLGAVLAFEVEDPRLRHPLRTTQAGPNPLQEQETMHLLTSWPIDHNQQPQALFQREARLTASRQLPSQKAINRRKALAEPGAHTTHSPTDPKIPIILLATRPPSSSGQGTWTVLLPWKCVLPIWYSLMFYPLSTGGTVRFGGLEQKRQMCFEAGVPWFPGDYPGTAAGMEWETQQREKRKTDWEKRPKRKRVSWESVDLGHGRRGEIGMGWACDWERLVNGPSAGAQAEESVSPKTVLHLNSDESRKRINRASEPTSAAGSSDNHALSIVKITMLQRGVPSTCARIYRLPTTNAEWRAKCLSIADKAKASRKPAYPSGKNKPKLSAESPAHLRRKALAASLLNAPPPTQEEQKGDIFPPVPDEADLIGFVTTGNFNLADGKGTGVGSILIERALCTPEGLEKDVREAKKQRQLCVVRESGLGLARLARWDVL